MSISGESALRDSQVADNPLSLTFNLHARLVGYASAPDCDDTVSTQWFCLENSIKGYQTDSCGKDHIGQISQELHNALKNDTKFAAMHTILLCTSVLDDAGNPASSKIISFPGGSSEAISYSVSRDQVAKTLKIWLDRWQRWHNQAVQTEAAIQSGHSFTECGPVSKLLLDLENTPAPISEDAKERRKAELRARHKTNCTENFLELGPIPTEPISTTGMRFLIAEDNCVNIRMWQMTMERRGLNYSLVVNGQEAFDAYKSDPERYRCIFMDTSMPVLDGIRSAAMIREHERTNGLQPAVIVAVNVCSRGDFNLGDDSDFDYWLGKLTAFSREKGAAIESIMLEIKAREMKATLFSDGG